MTVCIAAVFTWDYRLAGARDPVWGWAGIAVSDRMITAGDIQYEPFQTKAVTYTPQIMSLIAGDYAPHSEAIRAVQQIARANPSLKPFDAAKAYGVALQAVRRRQAEDIILAPLGLNTDMFFGQQRDITDLFVSRITDQLQDFDGPDVAAIILGMEGSDAHIYEIDRNGSVHSFTDAGLRLSA